MRDLARFAIPLGLALLMAAPARAEDEEAVAALQKSGAKITRDDKAEGKPVLVVNFDTSKADDAAVGPVKGLTKIEKLVLNNTNITDAGLDPVKGLATLKKLYLVDTKIGDAGVEKLKELKELRVLSLAGTQVTDAGLEHLKGLANLEIVFLHGTKATPEGTKKLKEALPKLKVE
jgi:internalin A